eukprot:GHVU01031641.1.p2 GENE.GHVU01031641.1~~GHVU01031641.1.p2  ORF type:complete len:148 (-),score=10.10 GHVU01031641.1:2786-3229(-)
MRVVDRARPFIDPHYRTCGERLKEMESCARVVDFTATPPSDSAFVNVDATTRCATPSVDSETHDEKCVDEGRGQRGGMDKKVGEGREERCVCKHVTQKTLVICVKPERTNQGGAAMRKGATLRRLLTHPLIHSPSSDFAGVSMTIER